MSSKKTYQGDSSSSESDVSTETSSSDDGVGDSDDDLFHGPETEPRGSPPSSRTRSRSSTTTKTTSKSKSKSKVKRRLKVRTKSKSKATTKKDRTSNSNASSTTTKRTTSTPKDSSTDSVSPPRGKLIQKNPKIKSFKPKRITAGKPEERKDAIVDPKKIQSFVNPTGRMLTRKDIADPGEIGSFNGLHRGDNDHLFVYLRLVNYNPRKYTKVPVFEISKGMSNSTFCMSFYA